jgi:hypothetical protein
MNNIKEKLKYYNKNIIPINNNNNKINNMNINNNINTNNNNLYNLYDKIIYYKTYILCGIIILFMIIMYSLYKIKPSFITYEIKNKKTFFNEQKIQKSNLLLYTIIYEIIAIIIIILGFYIYSIRT